MAIYNCFKLCIDYVVWNLFVRMVLFELLLYEIVDDFHRALELGSLYHIDVHLDEPQSVT